MAHPALPVAASFVSGSIPFAWIAARLVKGVDLRTVGSGNVGATNASRVLGGRWFFVVFLLDAAKGAVPVLLLAPLAVAAAGSGADPGSSPEWYAAEPWPAMLCGFAAILGHVFCPWLGFRGGKGVATGAGVLTALAPAAALCAFAVFGVVLAATRYMGLASCVAAASLAPAAWLLDAPAALVVFCVLVAALVVVRHRGNLARIAAGTEPKMFTKRAPSGADAAAAPPGGAPRA